MTAVPKDSGQAAFYIGMEAADMPYPLANAFWKIWRQRSAAGAPGIKARRPPGQDAGRDIRAFDRRGREHGFEVVLLFDEAEALI